MNTQLKTTPFGQLVRLLSANKFFRYPDEDDPSLWNKPAREGNTKSPEPSMGEAKLPSKELGALARTFQNKAAEADKEIHVVEWYSADDPEV